MDCATVSVLEFLLESLLHPLNAGWATCLGILMLGLSGFLLQMLAITRIKQTALRVLPLLTAFLFCLYGEARWNGWFLSAEQMASLPTDRFSGFIFCFVGLPMLIGAGLAWLVRAIRRWKAAKAEQEDAHEE
ncbi:hypothetical protein H7U37_00130 [Pseudoflavonifractor phocaeensis]|uniref:hypothetical protein n=1 Tax=Pseudoflavonifractor phocaeensis TaxID=1870988 RepID=UPI00195D652A|nr:hypothetical protein [Pseudoflavonifractor phocaeensis]MBM6871015.1 hypothetical protein [Pseudoflavonifractor phocaeensis]MBM6936939.1 hypothetical protein [Pseudoflavonifractor phocaeensis]